MTRTATFLCCLGVLGGSLLFGQNYRCDWSVNGIGGGDMSSAAYRCGSTAGQTAAGQLTGTAYWALIGFWQTDMQVGIREEARSEAGSLVTRLYAPQPNPFRSRATIRYSLATAEPAALCLYDQTGRLVRSWAVSRGPSAVSSVVWDCRDTHGRTLANGVYFCRLVAGDTRQTEKLVMQK